MLNGTLKDEDVNWDSPESLAALLLTSKILDNTAKAEEKKPPTQKGNAGMCRVRGEAQPDL